MAKELLIGIDVGTTSAKSVLFDLAGTILAEATQEYATAYPHPNWAEQDPEDWWQAVCTTLHRIFAGSRYAAAEVAALGVSSQAPSVVPVDSAGNLLHPALIWMDRRTDPQCEWLSEHVGAAAIASINGGLIDPYFMAPKLLWYKEQRPELYRATQAVLQANGYIVYRLTGELSMDSSHGPLTLLFDSRRGDWSDELLSGMHIDPARLPPIAPCSQVIGEVTRTAAEAAGLTAGTPVIAGMVDGTAASLEAGVLDAGDAVEMTGQSTVLLICSDRPYLEDKLFSLGHAIPDRHLVVGAQVASGGSLRWFRDQLGEPEREEAERRSIDPFEVLGERAAISPPGANRLVFLPYMYGERSPIWDSRARGVFFGLSLATSKADLVRAIMEGAAYGLRHNVDAAARAGFHVQELACVGGGARSPLWNQIKADVLQRPVRVPRTATGAPLGDAIAAAAAVGLYRSLADAVHNMTSPGVEYRPRPALAHRYDALFQIYQDLYPALRESFANLALVPDD
jgi:xylulokinase